jgi:predicted nucleic acid-binding protein
MAEVILDANVLVALLDAHDVHAPRASALLERLEKSEDTAVVVDFLVSEAISVLSRRARERRVNPPDLGPALVTVKAWYDIEAIRFLTAEVERLFPTVLAVITETGGTLNFNDSLLVALQRAGTIEAVASFDEGLDSAAGFRRIA